MYTARAPVSITALVPAHNEEGSITDTVNALLTQEHPVDRLIVICDNCTDDTEAVARKAGAETYITVDNKHMKAGGLNTLLALVMPDLGDDDLVSCVDADSIVGANFISEAARKFAADAELGGVSGTYQGKTGGGLAGWCQRNEFARWGFDNTKQGGRTVILSGAASVFRVRALRKVIAARKSGELGGQDGVYNVENITEDFELSLALRATGSKIRNMLNVTIMTAVKPTWGELWTQRLRWDRGINEGLFQFGVTPYTATVWFKRVMYALFIPVSLLIIFMIGYHLSTGGMKLSPFWIALSGIMMVSKAWTIRTRGWKNVALAFLLVPEFPYDTYLQLTFMRAVWDQFTGKTKRWR
jgi:poly-beta-1,6-N-acetyl-D-glucosamine synthase